MVPTPNNRQLCYYEMSFCEQFLATLFPLSVVIVGRISSLEVHIFKLSNFAIVTYI